MDLTQILLFFIIIIPLSIVHEYAHGWMANHLGDPTAKNMGRLTLNPVAHIDPWGTILMPILFLIMSGGSFVFAYAKPVPFNPYNLKDRRWDPAKVAAAGPVSNLILALIFALIFRFVPVELVGFSFLQFLYVVVYVNVLLAVFNLVPIPPLDGSKILFAVLPNSAQRFKIFMDRYGMFILLFFIFFGFRLIIPIIQGLVNILVGA
jgi:Zn-dependent protease